MHETHPFTRAVVEKFLERARNLKAFPYTGRIVPEFGDDAIRECFIYSYRMIYLIRDDAVLVVSVVHGKRMLESFEARIKESK